MSLLLARTAAAPLDLVPALPADAEAAHRTLTSFAAGVLGPGWERLFAAPRAVGGEVLWESEGRQAERYLDLPAEDRAALRDSLGRAVSTLRRAAEGADRALLPLLAAAIEVPDWESVHLVDGVPVLAPWGLRPTGRAAATGPVSGLDDGLPARTAPAMPPAPILATAAALALLALAAVLLAPWLLHPLAPPVATTCRADPGQIAALGSLLGEETREQALAADLASLRAELGRRRSDCPIAELPPDPPPPPRPPPPRPEPRPPPPPPPPQRPPDAQPCDEETQSGGRGITRTRHYLGRTPGRVTLSYNTLVEPDHIEVLYRGRQLATTWIPVSGRGTLAFDWQPTGTGPDAHTVEVIVTGFGLTTRWRYTLGCPR